MKYNLSIHDALKIKSIFLYVLNKLGEADMITIFKMIYFANIDNLKLYGRQIMPDTFIAMPQGPVPSFLKDAIDMQRGSNYMHRDNVDILSGCIKTADTFFTLKPLCKPDMTELSASDIECLDKAICENKQFTPKELSDKSHDDAWLNTLSNKPMSIMDMAAVSGASPEMRAYIKEHEEFDKLIEM